MTFSRHEIRKLVAQLFEDTKVTDEVRAGCFLIATFVVGPVPDRIAKVTGYSKARVDGLAAAAWASQIWTAQGAEVVMDYPWMDKLLSGDLDVGRVGFICDCLALTGQVSRTVRDGKPVYALPRPGGWKRGAKALYDEWFGSA